jgi:hypothetical protein
LRLRFQHIDIEDERARNHVYQGRNGELLDFDYAIDFQFPHSMSFGAIGPLRLESGDTSGS